MWISWEYTCLLHSIVSNPWLVQQLKYFYRTIVDFFKSGNCWDEKSKAAMPLPFLLQLKSCIALVPLPSQCCLCVCEKWHLQYLACLVLAINSHFMELIFFLLHFDMNAVTIEWQDGGSSAAIADIGRILLNGNTLAALLWYLLQVLGKFLREILPVLG